MRHTLLISATGLTLSIAALGYAQSASQAPDGRRPSAARTTSSASGVLTSRVEAYWNRRQAKDLISAYAFYCTAYRNRVPQAEFLTLTRLVRVDLREVRVARVNQIGHRAEVWVSLRFLLPTVSPDPLDSELMESWVRDADNRWCKEEEPSVLPIGTVDRDNLSVHTPPPVAQTGARH